MKCVFCGKVYSGIQEFCPGKCGMYNHWVNIVHKYIKNAEWFRLWFNALPGNEHAKDISLVNCVGESGDSNGPLFKNDLR